jgi:hypothetical protein
MAKCSIKINEEQCKQFVEKVFKEALDIDFDYVVQAVKEKMERDKGTSIGDQSIKYARPETFLKPELAIMYKEGKLPASSYMPKAEWIRE